jgi:hypothetical protein
MRYFTSLFLFAGLCLGVSAGCSNEKKPADQSGAAPPPPVQKGKPAPSQAEK